MEGQQVFLAGDRAYKIKRAVRYDYMDFSTLAKRRAALEKEFGYGSPMAIPKVTKVVVNMGVGEAIGGAALHLPDNIPANQYVTFKGDKASASRGIGRSIGWYADRLEPDERSRCGRQSPGWPAGSDGGSRAAAGRNAAAWRSSRR